MRRIYSGLKTSTSRAVTKAKSIFRRAALFLKSRWLGAISGLHLVITKVKSFQPASILFWKRRSTSDKTKFYPLYPTAEPHDHTLYIDILNDALSDKGIHNIALTGGYGSGKSSILKGFTKNKQKRTVFISFSTLGANIKNYTIENPAKEGDKDRGIDSIANLIQKEIVKHILYREKYTNIPASRYPKIHEAKFVNVLVWALAITAVVPLAMFALGFLNFRKLNNLKAAILMALFFVISSFLLEIIIPLLKRLQPDKISGGPVSIALSTSTNYFDQYLDEIIYFFETTKYDIVVLEDIDRFNDLYIFENLRQLNALLNNSKQINKNIRFIYAVKDSIFHDDEAKQSFIDDGNRTKFFDLIVPTVPFITHKNSRDIMSGMFAEKYGVARGVIGIVSKHVTDMRLVKNIYNEFAVFYQKIFEEGKIRDLSASNLFALIVYKNIEVQDFEMIKLGTSKLDIIYTESRAFIEEQSNELNNESASIREDMRANDSIRRRSDDLGAKLVAHLQDMLDDNNGVLASYEFNGKSYNRNNHLKTKEFWADVCGAANEEVLKLTYEQKVPRGQWSSGRTSTLTLSVEEIKRVMGDNDLDVSRWQDSDLLPMRNRLKTIDEEANLIRTQSIKQLMSGYPNFREKVIDCAKSDLLSDLMAAGYIDANYVLYTSIYREESISARGMNYIIQNIQKNKPDVYYTFGNDDDVKNTLQDLDDVYFEGRSIYNFDILNHLLRNRDTRVKLILGNLAEGTRKDIAFLDKYMDGDNEVVALTAALVQLWPRTFDYLASSPALNETKRCELFHIAIVNANEELEYESTDNIRLYLADNSTAISCIAREFSSEATNKAGRLFRHFGPKIASVVGIENKGMLSVIEENDLYEINAINLEKLVGSRDLSLDNIKKHSSHVFAYTCGHAKDYLDAIANTETPHTIVDGHAFIEILGGISGQDLVTIDAVVEKASDDCLVEDITSTEEPVWAALIEHLRVVNTIHNVLHYFIKNDLQLDDKLTDYLDVAENLTGTCEEEEHKDSKYALAVAILNTRKIKSENRVRLADDLDLKVYLDIKDIQAEDEMFGKLLAEDMIEDTEDSFNQLEGRSWGVKEQFIANSSNFLQYIADVKFSTDDLSSIPKSPIIGEDVKAYLLDNIPTYKDLLSTEGEQRLAEYALEKGIQLGVDVLASLFGSLPPDTCIQLILLSQNKLSRENILTLMPLVGDDFSRLTQASNRPLLLDNNANRQLVGLLRSLNIVSSYEEKTGQLRVNVKSKL